MATLNTLFYEDRSKGQKIFFDASSNSLTLSGVTLKLDKNLNFDVIEKVNIPLSGSSAGTEGQIAYDDNHIYLCVRTGPETLANWVRSKLTNFGALPSVLRVPPPPGDVVIPVPQYWWPLTSNGSSSLSIPYTFVRPNESSNVTFDINDGVTTSNTASLHNYSNPVLVTPSKNNTSFSISFQTKRFVDFDDESQSHGFLFGNAFGDLGFHFEFVNNDQNKLGNYLRFSLATHASVNGLTKEPYRWKKVISNNIIPLNQSVFVVGVNEAQGVDAQGRNIGNIKLYINGALQSTTYYTSKIFSLYAQPNYYGASIGAGNIYPGAVEYESDTKMKNLTFWNNTALNQEEISYIYNNGSVKIYPYN